MATGVIKVSLLDAPAVLTFIREVGDVLQEIDANQLTLNEVRDALSGSFESLSRTIVQIPDSDESR